MNIVTIYTAHNATVCYFEDGRCEKVLHEEKFNNCKNYMGFPVQALEYLSGLYDFKGVDLFIFPYSEMLWEAVPNAAKQGKAYGVSNALEDLSRSWLRKIYNGLEYYTGLKDIFFEIRKYIWDKRVTPRVAAAVEAYLFSTYGVPREKIRYYDHHTCHALTPFYFYNLHEAGEDVVLLTMDGAGDKSFSKVFVYDSGKRSYRCVANSRYDASLGLLYSGVTRFLGMKPFEHEYKVMGLAAYVTEEKYFAHILEELRRIVWLDEESLTFRSRFNTDIASQYFKKRFCGERFDNVSAAVQKLLEELVIAWVQAVVRKTGVRTIACSGGVFMNVKMNKKIQELPGLKKVYFMPCSGDESLGVGAACKAYLDAGAPMQSDKSLYKGHAYTEDEVREFLGRSGALQRHTVSRHEDIELKIAELLSEHKVVARFKGACEWGARSLCNRGILGHAGDLATFYEINDAIKMRDFWMPFAPTILEEWADRYIQNWHELKDRVLDSSRYMITAFDATALAASHLRAAIHQKDKTLRPQVVRAETDGCVYKLLKHYERLTGTGGILNTSLNVHGYPLAGTLEQSLFTFENSGLRYMAVENYLLEKGQ